MTRPRFFALAVLFLVLALLAGCAPKADYTARFLRYTKLEDGKQVAVVTPVGNGPTEQQTAFTDITDLKAGDLVLIRVVGKDWDEPQWTPERVIESRASRP